MSQSTSVYSPDPGIFFVIGHVNIIILSDRRSYFVVTLGRLLSSTDLSHWQEKEVTCCQETNNVNSDEKAINCDHVSLPSFQDWLRVSTVGYQIMILHPN
jgi:hypothetical protein